MSKQHLALDHPDVTFDGHQARIGDFVNRQQKFALVWQIHCPVHQAQFSWKAVDSIISKGGKFKS